MAYVCETPERTHESDCKAFIRQYYKNVNSDRGATSPGKLCVLNICKVTLCSVGGLLSQQAEFLLTHRDPKS
jgi:hypothetical protein